MVASSKQPYLSPEAYLQFEEKSPVKHEHMDGQVYAMAGASDAHVTIASPIPSTTRHLNSGALVLRERSLISTKT